MELIADGVLILAATVAGVYCLVLSRRLHSLTQMETGLGKAITGMSAQVDEMKLALAEAKSSTEESAKALAAQAQTAEEVAAKLEALIKSAEEIEAKRKADEPPTSREPNHAEIVESSARPAEKRIVKPAKKATKREQIDGLISSYLDEFEGEDEAKIAHRLVAALTAAGPLKAERAI